MNAVKELQTSNYAVIKNYIDSYRENLDDDISQSQKYRFSVFLIPKIGNNANSSDLVLEFVNTNNLSLEQIQKCNKNIVLIKEKEIENPFKYRPKQVVEQVGKTIIGFHINLHTQCWKYYKARKQRIEKGFKGQFSEYSEIADMYLYCGNWIKRLERELLKPDVLQSIREFRDK